MQTDFISPPVFGGLRIRGFFTTKKIGADIKEISSSCGVPESHIYLPIQKHTDGIAVIDHDLEPVVADAVVTRRRDLLIGVRVADCVPVLVYERVTGVIAAVHAGWRGTAEEILRKTLGVMINRFHASAEEMFVAIGPSIRGCSYGVDHDVMNAVTKATGEGEYHSEKGGRFFLDLASANKCQALSIGVAGSRIWVSEDCTFCRPDRYYSYRYAKGTTGRQGGFIIGS